MSKVTGVSNDDTKLAVDIKWYNGTLGDGIEYYHSVLQKKFASQLQLSPLIKQEHNLNPSPIKPARAETILSSINLRDMYDRVVLDGNLRDSTDLPVELVEKIVGYASGGLFSGSAVRGQPCWREPEHQPDNPFDF